MKPTYTFHFADEPQFRTRCGRMELAHRLRAYRNRANGNWTRYSIARVPGGFAVRLRTQDAPLGLFLRAEV